MPLRECYGVASLPPDSWGGLFKKIFCLKALRAEPTCAWAYLTNGECMAYVICKVCFQNLKAYSISEIFFRNSLKYVFVLGPWKISSGEARVVGWVWCPGRCWPVLGGTACRINLCFRLHRACSPLLPIPALYLPTSLCSPSWSLHSKSVEPPPTSIQWELGKVHFKSRPWLVGLGGIVRKIILENRQSRKYTQNNIFFKYRTWNYKIVNFLFTY